MLAVPGNEHGKAIRHVTHHAMKCVWESLEEELTQRQFDDNNAMRIMQQHPAERGETILDTTAYKHHPVTVRCREAHLHPPVPLALYLDGVTYQKGTSGRNDTAVGH
eukprot:7779894-Pyramimonas_sp.AAC.1